MASNNEDQARIIISQLNKTPGFSKLPEDARNRLINRAMQDKFGTIPKTGNFLENAIRAVDQSGKMAFQITQAPVMDAPQMALENPRQMSTEFDSSSPITRGISMGMAGIKPGENELDLSKYLEPEDQPYKTISDVGSFVAPFVLPGMMAGKAAGKGINSLRTAPIQKEISSIEDLINMSKKAEAPIKEEVEQIGRVGKYLKMRGTRNAKSLGYKAAKDIGENVAGSFESAKSNYGQMLEKIDPSKVTTDDNIKVLDKLINEKGILKKLPEYRDPVEREILSLRNHMASAQEGRAVAAVEHAPITEEITKFDSVLNPSIESKVITPGFTEPAQSGVRKLNDPTMLKNFKNRVFNTIKQREDMVGSFYKHYGDMLQEKGLSEFTQAHGEYSKAYEAWGAAKKLKGNTISQVAKGSLPKEQVADLGKLESKIGTSYVEKASSQAQKNKLSQYMLEQRGKTASKRLAAKAAERESLSSKLPELERKVKDVRFKQAVVGATGIAGGLLSKLFGLDRQQH